MQIGLALSGGAAKGIAHIGVLKYLEEREVKISRVAGTSAGGIVGALYCAGLSLGDIEKSVLELNWKEFFKPTLPKIGLIDSSHVEKFVEEHIGKVTFKELKIPLLVNAVDLLSGKEVILREGPVAPAVRASCAIPGIFTPVKLEEMLLVDGGLLNNVPAKPLKEEGVDFLVAVDINAQRPLIEKPKSIFEVLMQSFYIMQRNRDLGEHRYADVLVEPKLKGFSIWDISKAEELVERGYSAARESLERVDFKRGRKRIFRWF